MSPLPSNRDPIRYPGPPPPMPDSGKDVILITGIILLTLVALIVGLLIGSAASRQDDEPRTPPEPTGPVTIMPVSPTASAPTPAD